MTPSHAPCRWATPVLAGIALCFLNASAFAQGTACASGSCATGTCETGYCLPGVAKFCCPPFYKHVQEGPPKLCFKQGCPKPVCDPCQLDHFGYYQTCWRPWPYTPDWRHCTVPPPSVVLLAPPMHTAPRTPFGVMPNTPPQKLPEPTSPLPTPRKIEEGKPVKPL